MTDGASRHIANLKFGAQTMRLYLGWPFDGDGESALRQALSDIERIAGPQARDVADFIARSRKTFIDYGFVEFRS